MPEDRERVGSPQHATEHGQEEARRWRVTSTDAWALRERSLDRRTAVPPASDRTSSLAPEQTLDFDTLQPPGRIIRLEQRACEAAPG